MRALWAVVLTIVVLWSVSDARTVGRGVDHRGVVVGGGGVFSDHHGCGGYSGV